MKQVFIGQIVHSKSLDELEVLENGFVAVNDGVVCTPFCVVCTINCVYVKLFMLCKSNYFHFRLKPSVITRNWMVQAYLNTNESCYRLRSSFFPGSSIVTSMPRKCPTLVWG